MGNTPTTITKTRQELREIAANKLKDGIPDEEVHQYLLSEGLDLNSVYAIMGSLTQGNSYYRKTDDFAPSNRASNGTNANRDIIIGGLWFFGGIAITLVSYNSGGNSYIVAWGAILFGGIQLMRGLTNNN